MATPAKKPGAALVAALQATTPGKTNDVSSPYPKGPKNAVGKENDTPSPYPKGPKNDTPSPYPKGPKGSAPKKTTTVMTPQRRRIPDVKVYGSWR